MDPEEDSDGHKKENVYLNDNTVHGRVSYAQSSYNLTIYKGL